MGRGSRSVGQFMVSRLLPEAVYNLGLSLKHEEVIKGNAELGTTLIDASEDVEDYTATQGFVKKSGRDDFRSTGTISCR
ncbi:MAG: hypothetical protein K2M91_12700 [Lachnospiraceae bacterium]|nr:hypothetical protein [Lachnospiraceae bacterium]